MDQQHGVRSHTAQCEHTAGAGCFPRQRKGAAPSHGPVHCTLPPLVPRSPLAPLGPWQPCKSSRGEGTLRLVGNHNQSLVRSHMGH